MDLTRQKRDHIHSGIVGDGSSKNTLTGRDRHECLDGPPGHHTDHHGGKDGDGVTRHVHDEEVHGDLLQGAQGNIPAALERWKRKQLESKKRTPFSISFS